MEMEEGETEEVDGAGEVPGADGLVREGAAAVADEEAVQRPGPTGPPGPPGPPGTQGAQDTGEGRGRTKEKKKKKAPKQRTDSSLTTDGGSMPPPQARPGRITRNTSKKSLPAGVNRTNTAESQEDLSGLEVQDQDGNEMTQQTGGMGGGRRGGDWMESSEDGLEGWNVSTGGKRQASKNPDSPTKANQPPAKVAFQERE